MKNMPQFLELITARGKRLATPVIANLSGQDTPTVCQRQDWHCLRLSGSVAGARAVSIGALDFKQSVNSVLVHLFVSFRFSLEQYHVYSKMASGWWCVHG